MKLDPFKNVIAGVAEMAVRSNSPKEEGLSLLFDLVVGMVGKGLNVSTKEAERLVRRELQRKYGVAVQVFQKK